MVYLLLIIYNGYIRFTRSRSPPKVKDKRISSSRHEQKSDRRENERSYGRKRSKSRSPRYRELYSQNKIYIIYLGDHEKDRAKDKHEREEREQNERERRRMGLPGRLKSDHILG